ncbi:MAG: tRNA lysidine(34) synthetase TilS [Ruminococcaceae bacterium]|nr:tRNA lysidine(34) synthetase TilS [Oscillospiraceae bacterium]
MLNKILAFNREYALFSPGDRVICAVSGGADSMALLWGMYMLREKLGIILECAHFNHRLRGAESERDSAFVRQFCADYHIPFHYSAAQVVAGEKGLEAAARDARYAYLRSLPGKIATAHTADDNAETVLMHLLRGTGLKGLGGIAPQSGNVIRPMLSVTRQEVLAFLEEYSIPYVEDSSNSTDDFLRNRLRHNVVPILRAENPKFAPNVSQMALRLRQDEACLQAQTPKTASVSHFADMAPAIRARAIAAFLEDAGVKDAGAQQIASVEGLLASKKPSASVSFPGNVVIRREYDSLKIGAAASLPEPVRLPCPGSVTFGNWRISARIAEEECNAKYRFTVYTQGDIYVRSKTSGDRITFAFGTKSLKKLFIDDKIPAAQRPQIPVIADEKGILGVCGYGADLQRGKNGVPVEISIVAL